MKIQPLDPEWPPPSGLAVATKPPAAKSRLKRLFERQFPGVLRIGGAGDAKDKDREVPSVADFEPSSVCLAKMVQNFLEDNNDNSNRHSHARSRCNCFNGNRDDSSDDELDLFFTSSAAADAPSETSDILKSLVLCPTPQERDLLADVIRIKSKEGPNRKAIVDGLIALGYNASTCKSTWEKTSSIPAGEHEYIDVILEGGERLIVDIEFRAEFEIARPHKAYRAMLQTLPVVMVGKAERIQQVVALAAEAARLSLKKKGLHVPPWRKCEYIKLKWLGTYRRDRDEDVETDRELDPRLDEQSGESPETVVLAVWEPPAVEPKAPTLKGAKVVAGLASIF